MFSVRISMVLLGLVLLDELANICQGVCVKSILMFDVINGKLQVVLVPC
jgi:hypothetical protein